MSAVASAFPNANHLHCFPTRTLPKLNPLRERAAASGTSANAICISNSGRSPFLPNPAQPGHSRNSIYSENADAFSPAVRLWRLRPNRRTTLFNQQGRVTRKASALDRLVGSGHLIKRIGFEDQVAKARIAEYRNALRDGSATDMVSQLINNEIASAVSLAGGSLVCR